MLDMNLERILMIRIDLLKLLSFDSACYTLLLISFFEFLFLFSFPREIILLNRKKQLENYNKDEEVEGIIVPESKAVENAEFFVTSA